MRLRDRKTTARFVRKISSDLLNSLLFVKVIIVSFPLLSLWVRMCEKLLENMEKLEIFDGIIKILIFITAAPMTIKVNIG